MRAPKARPIREPKKGILSRPRKITTGVYFITPSDRRSDTADKFEGGCGFTDPRWDDGSLHHMTWVDRVN